MRGAVVRRGSSLQVSLSVVKMSPSRVPLTYLLSSPLSQAPVTRHPPPMEAAQRMVKQRSMEALDKLRTFTNVEESLDSRAASAKEPSQS